MLYEIGDRLKALREARKLSQSQVARRLNISNSAISGYEKGTKTPSAEMLKTLAIFYNVSSDFLLGLEDRECINVDGLTDRQREVINILLTEFKVVDHHEKK